VRTVIIIALVIAIGAGCAESAGHAGSLCSQAAGLLSKPSLPTDGGTLVEDLKKLDLVGLTAADQEGIIAAIRALDQQLKRFNSGTDSDGWDTVALVDQLNRVCNSDIPSFRVTA
jgi:hypothetical protein